MKQGWITITYQFLLFQKSNVCIDTTRELYNQVLKFYYILLSEHNELLKLSDHLLLRELEILTIGTKEQKSAKINPKIPLEGFPKLPIYFRRAAISAAIGMMRSYKKRIESWEYSKEIQEKKCPSSPTRFLAAPVFYKGMYRNFNQKEIELKVFTGKRWEWIYSKLKGRKLPDNGKACSPILKQKGKQIFLYVPVKLPVSDIRTIRERMNIQENFLALAVPNGDCMAVGVVFEMTNVIATRFFYGGKEMKAYCERVLYRLRKSWKSRGETQNLQKQNEKFINSRWYKKIAAIHENYTHQISHQIIEYCKQQQISMIVVPKYQEMTDILNRRYYGWLGRSLISKLKYKAFRQGIIVSSIRPYHMTNQCSNCGAKIKRNKDHPLLFECPNGHNGNFARNTAINLGFRFLKYNLDDL